MPKRPHMPAATVPQLGSLAMPSMDFGDFGAVSVPDMGLLPKMTAPDVQASDPVEANVQAIADLSTIKGRAQEEQARFVQATDSEYWVCFCFENRDQKDEFLRRLKVPPELGDKHVDGLLAAKALGIELTTPRAKWGRARVNPKLAEMAEE